MERKVKNHLTEFNNANCKLIYGLTDKPVAVSFPKESDFIIDKKLLSQITREEYLSFIRGNF